MFITFVVNICGELDVNTPPLFRYPKPPTSKIKFFHFLKSPMVFVVNSVEIMATQDREMDAVFDNFHGTPSDGNDARNSSNCGSKATRNMSTHIPLTHGLKNARLGLEANKERGKEAEIDPMRNNRPIPKNLMDTPVKDLSNREFLWFYKMEVANVTPQQLLNQVGSTHHFMVGTILVSYVAGTAHKISKATARKIRKANNKKTQLIAETATN